MQCGYYLKYEIIQNDINGHGYIDIIKGLFQS